jgi:hypothetical protein
MPRTGFEPATKRPQTYALDRAATGIGKYICNLEYFSVTLLVYLIFKTLLRKVYEIKLEIQNFSVTIPTENSCIIFKNNKL